MRTRTERQLRCLVWLAVACVLVVPAWAQDDGIRSSAQIRIDLEPGPGAQVNVSHGNNRVTVELPSSATYPKEFSSVTGDLVRLIDATPVGTDRVRLELEMTRGLLTDVEYAPNRVVLKFESRYAAATSTTDPKNGVPTRNYVLGPDDKIIVAVHNQPELDKRLKIERDGSITVPLLGDVKAAGLTPRELGAKLTEMMGRSYLVNPQIDVEVEEFNSQWVMISGQVRLAGKIPLKGGTRLKEVLSEAGGFEKEAGEWILLSRPHGTDFVVQRIPRADFERGDVNPVLDHGDIIDIPRAQFCYVQGEVRSPGAVKIDRGMTLLKAIALSSGLTEWADRRDVVVKFTEDPSRPDQQFDLKRIINGKHDDPSLTGGEIVIVKRRFF